MEKIIAIKPEKSFEEEKKEQELLSEISEILRKPYSERIKQEQEFRKLVSRLEELTITPYISRKSKEPPRLEKVTENLPRLLRIAFDDQNYQIDERCYG